MANRPAHDVAARRVAIIDLIGAEGMAVEEIHRRLRPKAGLRTVHEDIAWLLTTFPAHLSREKAGVGRGCRIVYRWQGQVPYLLDKPLGWLTEDELIALVAARGLLRDADPAKPATSNDPDPDDLLAGALSRLLDRAGVQDAAKILDRHVLTVSRFGAAPLDHRCLSLALAATATGETLEFTYENLAGISRRVSALPLRCLLVKGEWYCVAWAGSIKHYRIARMSDPERKRQRPEGAPSHVPAREVDALLASAFYATGSDSPKDRLRVTIAVGPQAWPHLRDRRWGDNQVLTEQPNDLPAGWRRLSFVTSGLAECQHWILGMGSTVRAEGPKSLVTWISQQVRQMGEHLDFIAVHKDNTHE